MRRIHLGQMARMAALFAAPLLLSSCLLFFRDPKLPKLPEEKYDVNEDSTFFSKMPPYSEEGKNIVAFEIDGKPYVYPKPQPYFGFISPLRWECYIKENDTSGGIQLSFYVSRLRQQYNPTRCSFCMDFPQESLNNQQVKASNSFFSFSTTRGYWSTGDGHGVQIKLAKLDPEKRIISGTFEGVLKNSHTPTKTIEIKNGFFDLVYIDKRDQ